jgi:hypothetical protein
VVGGGAASTIGGPVVLGGGAILTVSLDGAIGGAVTLAGGPGAPASLGVGAFGGGQLWVRGPVRLAPRTPPPQGVAFLLTRLVADGPVSVLGGAGGDLLQVDDCTFLGSFGAALGAGTDQFRVDTSGLTGPTTFAGPAVFRGGDGADEFFLGGGTAASVVAFRGPVTVDGGAGTDTVSVGTTTTFDPAHPPLLVNFP